MGKTFAKRETIAVGCYEDSIHNLDFQTLKDYFS